jgi:lactate dehydrogenase-like 2-hydroxyacid dehydrogenase
MSTHRTVLIPDRLKPPADIEAAVFSEKTTIHTPEATASDQISTSLWADADVVLAWHDVEFDRELLSKLDSCNILVRVGVGFDNIDLEAAGDFDIPVCNVPDYGTNDVADHTMSLLLSLWRGIPYYNERVNQSNDGWTWESRLSMRRLTSATIAIVGLGRIGTAVALRAKAFGMTVVAYDPYVPDGYEKSLGINRVRELENAIQDADVVSFHTPLTEETRGMANQAFFKTLADDAVVINTARGKIIHLDSLYEALRSGTVRAAGLDVLEQEPPDSGHPLITAWRDGAEWIEGRLLLTPHAAFYCEEALEEMRRKAAQTAYEFVSTGLLRNCVNEQYLDS